jgi:hypothetical protein
MVGAAKEKDVLVRIPIYTLVVAVVVVIGSPRLTVLYCRFMTVSRRTVTALLRLELYIQVQHVPPPPSPTGTTPKV